MAEIHFIFTGGTIDFSYDSTKGVTVPNSNSVIPEYIINKIKPHYDISFETICMLDSDDVKGELHEKIMQSVINASADRIIITHGTNTMEVTAKYLDDNLVDSNKTVILTGAMIPLKEFAMSDGGFNLGYAIAQLQSSDAGVYVAMNAQLFDAGKVKKNREVGRFESI